MKKLLVILLLSSLVLGTYAKEYALNLSTLKKGDKAQRDVWIVNSSEKSIHILSVETGCVCTKASFDKNEIQAGDSSKVHITFSAKDPGVFYKIVYVKTSEQSCDSKITIRGKVN